MPTFSSLALSPELVSVVAELGYTEMTPIQAESIPVLLAGKDLVGQSKTGSGKTTAFGLPLLQKLDLGKRVVQALILCPTRELCAQVTRELRKLARNHAGATVLSLAGGESMRDQIRALKVGVHIVVGTPGRVLDHLGRGSCHFGNVATLVLDEADRMLEMGFQADIEKILQAAPQPRQTVFFSATFPGSIAQMSRVHQRAPVRVTITEPSEVPPDIIQELLLVEPEKKLDALCSVLCSRPHESALIFCNHKATVTELYNTLLAAGVSVDCLHGDLEQPERDVAMARFRNESVRLLLATDVAARGIDVLDLDLVVNYDLPVQPDVYVHRIGRTGRAGKTGLAVSLGSAREQRLIDAIQAQTGAPLPVAERQDKHLGLDRLLQKIARPAKRATIGIAGGRKDKLRPGDILGALTGEAGGLKAEDTGKIEIGDRVSYVAVTRSLGGQAVKSVNAGRIKGKRFRAWLCEPSR